MYINRSKCLGIGTHTTGRNNPHNNVAQSIPRMTDISGLGLILIIEHCSFLRLFVIDITIWTYILVLLFFIRTFCFFYSFLNGKCVQPFIVTAISALFVCVLGRFHCVVNVPMSQDSFRNGLI